MSSRTCNLNFSGSKILTCSAYCSVHMRIALRLTQQKWSLHPLFRWKMEYPFQTSQYSRCRSSPISFWFREFYSFVCFFRISRMLKINIFLGCIPTMRGPLRPLYPTGTDFATTLCGEKRTSSFFIVTILRNSRPMPWI